MTGSQAEWCNDWFDENYYKNSPSINPKGPNEGTHRIVRGASWRGLKDDSRVFYREVLPPIIPPMESIMDCVLY
jgi:formylglycine-generating enzyme required for sulfatase activity